MKRLNYRWDISRIVSSKVEMAIEADTPAPASSKLSYAIKLARSENFYLEIHSIATRNVGERREVMTCFY